MQKMTLIVSSILLVLVGLFSTSLVRAGYEDPLPNASCIDGILKIYMNPRHVSTIHAVRIDNKDNPWSETKPYYSGDIFMNQVKGSAFVRDVGTGRSYDWWIYDVGQNGVINFASKKSGTFSCLPLANPVPPPDITKKGSIRFRVSVNDQNGAFVGYFNGATSKLTDVYGEQFFAASISFRNGSEDGWVFFDNIGVGVYGVLTYKVGYEGFWRQVTCTGPGTTEDVQKKNTLTKWEVAAWQTQITVEENVVTTCKD